MLKNLNMFLNNFFNFFSKIHHNRIAKYSQNLQFDNLVDIGCHKGEFLESFLKLKKIKKFYCFEPQKKIFKDLIKNFGKNKRVVLFNLALGSNSKMKKIYISNYLTSVSTMSKFNNNSKYLKFKNFLLGDTKRTQNSSLVKQSTVDHVFRRVPLKKTFFKIDVEGYEYNVLKGSRKKIKEANYVLVECQFTNQYKNSFNQVAKFLHKNKFEVIKNFYFPTLHYKDVLFKKKKFMII